MAEKKNLNSTRIDKLLSIEENMFTRIKRLAFNVWLLATLISLLTFTVALAASGDLDTTFSGDGLKATNFGGFEDANGIAIQPDRKIVVVGGITPGNNFTLARYKANGSLDPTFSGDGRLITDFGGDDKAYDVAVQQDGKIIAVGDTCSPVKDLCDLGMARYNPNGTLDTTFSKDGIVRTDIGEFDNGARGIALQPDGKIVVIGFSWDEVTFHFVFYRYTSTGRLDPTFSNNGDGTASGNFGATRQDFGTDVVIQPDGRIIGVGSSHDFASGARDFALARLTSNGILDPTFGQGGLRLTNFGGEDSATAVALQPDGKIVVVGERLTTDPSSTLFAIARYTASGRLDITFNRTGKKLFGFGSGNRSSANDVIVEPNGKIVVMGDTENPNADKIALARLKPNGSFDNTFGAKGKLAFGFCADFHEGLAVARQPVDGKYVLAGTTWCGPSAPDFAVARVLP